MSESERAAGGLSHKDTRTVCQWMARLAVGRGSWPLASFKRKWRHQYLIITLQHSASYSWQHCTRSARLSNTCSALVAPLNTDIPTQPVSSCLYGYLFCNTFENPNKTVHILWPTLLRFERDTEEAFMVVGVGVGGSGVMMGAWEGKQC